MYRQPPRGCLRESARNRVARRVRYVFSTSFLRHTHRCCPTTRQAHRCEIERRTVTCWRPDAVAPGLESPLNHLFQDLDVACLIRIQTLEPAVLALQFFQALHRVAVGGSVLRSSSIQCHQRHAKGFRNIFQRLSLR